MEYMVLYHYTANELSTDVNGMLQDGWKLQGGVSISISSTTQKSANKGRGCAMSKTITHFIYAQALIKIV